MATKNRTCTAEGCSNRYYSTGFCRPHYHQQRYRDNPERQRAYNTKYRAKAGYSDAEKAANEDCLRRLQAETVETAKRAGEMWEGWEMETAADRSREIKDVARILGRTYWAVASMRHKLLNDPQTIARAGISDSGRL